MRSIPRRRGLSIIEALMSLSISAMLLTAVAAAFSSSAATIRHNERFFQASHVARITMEHLLADLRRSHAVQLGTNSVSVATWNGGDRTYTYDTANQRIRMTDNDTGTTLTVAEEVTACAFTADSFTDAGGIKHVVRVAVAMEVTVDTNKVRLAGSAAVRRELAYE